MATTSTSEDDFLRVLEEMNRLCGGEDEAELEAAKGKEGPSHHSSDIDGDEAVTSNNDLDDIFASSSSAPLIGDQLLSSASATSTAASNSLKRTASTSNLQQPQGASSR